MSPNSGAFQAGVEAAQQRRYPEAVQLLEAFCQSCAGTGSFDCIQAQMWLVKAYQGSGQIELAIALCQQMATYDLPQTVSWAQKVLPVLLAARETQPLPAAEPEPTPEPTPREPAELFQAAKGALKQRDYSQAVPLLEQFLQGSGDTESQEHSQALMWLVKAYKGTGQVESARQLCAQLLNSENALVKSWAQQTLPSLSKPKAAKAEPAEPASPPPEERQSRFPKAGRAAKGGVKLAIAGVAGNLGLASTVTIGLLFGMVLVLCLNLKFIVSSDSPSTGLGISIAVTLVFNTVTFFLSPLLMDLTQRWLYGTRWVSLAEVEGKSPESARIIRQVCQTKNLIQPRLGIIDDQNPTAFTYGALPNSARLVVSEGLFTYLSDDEIATVYAHELGHIVHWDFAIMTLAATLLQITYLIYNYARRLSQHIDNKKVKDAAKSAATMAYVFHLVGTYLVLYLSRTREYFADHFAAQVTGNPNGLSRALVKIAYGILEEGERAQQPSQLVEGTRALGIYDPKAATSTGTAYRMAAQPQQIGRVFLWDMFNPWGWWMELSSTHPLTGKRIRALSTYAEQLGLPVEFDMALVVREGKKLSKNRLYGSFFADLLCYQADFLGGLLGFAIGMSLWVASGNPAVWKAFFWLWMTGIGIGILVKNCAMFPQPAKAAKSDVLALMSDPYASPLRGRFVQLEGELIGRGDAGYIAGSDLKLQDKNGMIFLRYASRFGPLGNLLFGTGIASSLIGSQVTVTGWFRRGVGPWFDLFRMKTVEGKTVNSYPRFWKLVMGVGAIILGFVLPALV